MFPVILRAERLLHIRHDAFRKFTDEALLHVRATPVDGQVDIAVRQDDQHRYSPALMDQVIRDEIDPATFVEGLLRVCCTVDHVEYRVFLPWFGLVFRRDVDTECAPFAHYGGIIGTVAHLAVRNITDGVEHVVVAHFNEAGLESFARKEEHVGRIADLDPVYDEVVLVDIRDIGMKGSCPDSVVPALHLEFGGELAVEPDGVGLRRIDTEDNAPVRQHFRGNDLAGLLGQGARCKQHGHEEGG